MRIGITFDLKDERADSQGLPDDFQEEFDSPVTIDAIAGVLRDLGHEVIKLGDGKGMLRQLLASPPDFVFNFAEGQGIGRSREARVPAVLEMLNIPFTGSDPLTMAATLDKDVAKRLVASWGVRVPESVLIETDPDIREGTEHALRCPIIVKPAWEGSSKGIRSKCLVDRPHKLRPLLEEMRGDYRQPILVEEYIDGDELTVGIVGNEDPEIIGIMRVLPTEPTDQFVYSLEVKRDFRKLVRYEVPAEIGAEATQAVRDATLRAFAALGCRDVSRIDFRLRDGVPYFLEVNPLPGLNPESSDLVILSDLAGWTYPQLIRSILDAALKRHGLIETPARSYAQP